MPRPSPTVPRMNGRATGIAIQARATIPRETIAPARVPEPTGCQTSGGKQVVAFPSFASPSFTSRWIAYPVSTCRFMMAIALENHPSQPANVSSDKSRIYVGEPF